MQVTVETPPDVITFTLDTISHKCDLITTLCVTMLDFETDKIVDAFFDITSITHR